MFSQYNFRDGSWPSENAKFDLRVEIFDFVDANTNRPCDHYRRS